MCFMAFSIPAMFDMVRSLAYRPTDISDARVKKGVGLAEDADIMAFQGGQI